MTTDYRALALKNGIERAVYEALADIFITSLEQHITQYKNGTITALEFLEYIDNLKEQR